MICYIIRHGKDDETVRGGWSQHPLTGEGIIQIEKMAESLRQKKEKLSIKQIYTSDLHRAMQTAQILADELQVPVVPLFQFREVNNGDLAGIKNDTALVRYPGLYWNQMEWEQSYPNGESPKQFYDRIKAAWFRFTDEIQSGNENVILVTHGGVIHIIRSLLENRPYVHSEKQRSVRYGEILTVSFDNGIWKEIESI